MFSKLSALHGGSLHRDVVEALDRAVSASTNPKAADAEVKSMWEVFRAACQATGANPAEALSSRSILKDLYHAGQLRHLAHASREVYGPAGGLKPALVDIPKKGTYPGYRGQYVAFGDIHGQPAGQGLLSSELLRLSGRGVVQTPSWSAAGQFNDHHFVGDITFHWPGHPERFHGRARIDENVGTWALMHGARHDPLGHIDEGTFDGVRLTQGSRRWLDGTTVAMAPSPNAFGRPDLNEPLYIGEGTLTWPDGTSHVGILQPRVVVSGEATENRAYLLIQSDYTTVHFSLDRALKPDISTRLVARVQLPVTASANLMDI